MKLSYVTGLLLAITLVWACQQDLMRRGSATEGVVFACNAGCEQNKIYTLQGQCPMCRAPLASLRGVPAFSKDFEMRAMVRPTVPQAERPVEITLRPTRIAREDARVRLTGLDGTGRVHVLLVSEDLVWFDYLAAEKEEKGVYRLGATFPGGGSYLMFSEYQPRDAGNLVNRTNVNVTGAMLPKQFVLAGESLSAETDRGYQVDLLTQDAELRAETLTKIAFDVRHGKTAVQDFGKFLGAQGHLFLVRADRSGFAHLRAETGSDGRLHFNVPFGTPGTYRAFLQFQSGGQQHKASFTLNVGKHEPVRYTLNR